MAAGLTELEAVNKMLEAIGESPVAALGGSNVDATDAESILDRVTKEVCGEGWHANRRHKGTDGIQLELPDNSIGHGTITGTFEFDETVTETTSGATGKFKYTESSVMYLVQDEGSADFTGGETLTGGTSGATCTGTTQTDITSAKHALDDDWLQVDTIGESSEVDVSREGTFLFDIENDTATFSKDVYVEVLKRLNFDDVTPMMKSYIMNKASREFQQYKRGGRVMDGYKAEDTLRTRVEALHEDAENDDDNLIDNTWAGNMLGRRNRQGFNH